MKVRLTKDTKKKITTSVDIYEIMQKILLRENKLRRKQEYFWTIGLNSANILEYIELVALGKLNVVAVRPVELFSIAVQKRCDQIILIHNHPSGKLTPSKDDIAFTTRMKAAAELIEITVLDHIIISEKEFYSFEDNGML